MKKNWIKVGVLTLFLAALLLFIMGCEADDEEEISLSFATFWPAEDFQVDDGHKAWAEEIKEKVEEETPYAIDFTWHYGGELLDADEIFEGVMEGAADIGTTCPSYTPGRFPVTSAFELPGLENDNALVSSKAIQEAYETFDPVAEEYEGVELMHLWATGPGDVITVGEPVESLEDLDDMSIRVAGGSVPVAESLGATPVTEPMSEAYLSLEQGLVEGILSPTDVLKGFMLAEVTDYITKTPYLYNIVFMKIMNQDTWEQLPEEVQEIFVEVNQKYTYEYGVLRTEHTKLGQEFGVEEYGMEVIELPAEEEEKWLEAIEPVQDEWKDDAVEEGLPGEEIMETVLELDENYSEQYGDYFE